MVTRNCSFRKDRIIIGKNDNDTRVFTTKDEFIAEATRLTNRIFFSAAAGVKSWQDFIDNLPRIEIFRLVLRGLVATRQRRPFNNHNSTFGFNPPRSIRLLYPELCQ